jgi:hypothetical protein
VTARGRSRTTRAARRATARRLVGHNTWAVACWAGQWTRRGACWAGPQIKRRAIGHATRISAPARRWHDDVTTFGFRTPVVHDLSDGGTSYAADDPAPLPPAAALANDQARLAGDRALARQLHRDEMARVARTMRPLRLTRWQRMVLRARGEDPDALELRSQKAVVGALARRAERLSREAARRHPDPAPAAPAAAGAPVVAVPVQAGAVTPRQETVMANPVRSFADLREPDIDPFEFPEELPAHLREVARLVTERAAELEAEADQLRAQAADVRAYIEYMEGAEVDPGMLASLSDAAESMETAAAQRMAAVEEVGAAGDLVGHAAAAAESRYGDMEMPRFDKVS